MTLTKWILSCAIGLLCAAQTAIAATGLPFSSNFESGDFRDWDGGPVPTMTITSAQAAEGSRSVQSVLTRGQPTDSYQDYYFGDHPIVNGDPVTPAVGLWLTLASRFDNGFEFGANSIMHKIALINFDDENSRRRYQVIVNVQISTGQYFLEHLKWNADRSFNRAFAGFPQNVGAAVTPRFGQWDQLRLFIRPNTPGQNDGVVQFWVNDVLKADYSNVQLREDTPYNPNKLILSSYATDTTTSGIQRWDDFYLGETEPNAPVRPMPPTLHQVQ